MAQRHTTQYTPEDHSRRTYNRFADRQKDELMKSDGYITDDGNFIVEDVHNPETVIESDTTMAILR